MSRDSYMQALRSRYFRCHLELPGGPFATIFKELRKSSGVETPSRVQLNSSLRVTRKEVHSPFNLIKISIQMENKEDTIEQLSQTAFSQLTRVFSI